MASLGDGMRRNFLDGIRGWAALMVVFSHIVGLFAAAAAPALNKTYLLFPTDGHLAVSVFFVVSGFSLSIGFFESRNRRILLTLAIRRYPRLTIPIFASSAIAFILLQSGLFFNQRAGYVANSVEWLSSFYNFNASFDEFMSFSLFNVYFFYEESKSYNAVLWTMGVEMWGSIFTFILLAIGGGRWRWAAYIGLFIGFMIFKSHILAFLLGIVLADLYHQKILARFFSGPIAPICSLLCISAGIAFSYCGRPYYGDPRFLSMAAFSLVFGIVCWNPVCSIFETRLSVFLGKISFSLYLTHQLIVCSLSSYIFLYLVDHGSSLQAASNIMLAVSLPVIFIAALMFSSIDRKAIEVSRWVSSLALERWRSPWQRQTG